MESVIFRQKKIDKHFFAPGITFQLEKVDETKVIIFDNVFPQ